MTEPRRRIRLPRTLDAKFLYMILLSLLCAAAVYSAAYGLASLALEKIYMSPESVASRQAEIYSDFSKYVRTFGIAGSDDAALARFPGNDEYTTILVYRDEEDLIVMAEMAGDQAPLPDGDYDGEIVTESTTPLSFLLN